MRGFRRTTRLWAGVAAFVVAVGAVALGVRAVLPGCSDGERESFLVIRHLDGRELEPSHNFDADSCAAEFTTDESVADVVEHYRSELAAQSWTRYSATSRSSVDSVGQTMSRADATAEKGSFDFSLYIWSYDHDTTTHVTVHVAEY